MIKKAFFSFHPKSTPTGKISYRCQWTLGKFETWHSLKGVTKSNKYHFKISCTFMECQTHRIVLHNIIANCVADKSGQLQVLRKVKYCTLQALYLDWIVKCLFTLVAKKRQQCYFCFYVGLIHTVSTVMSNLRWSLVSWPLIVKRTIELLWWTNLLVPSRPVWITLMVRCQHYSKHSILNLERLTSAYQCEQTFRLWSGADYGRYFSGCIISTMRLI